MTPNAFRRLALSLPNAVEASHMGHPDFRVGGKVFATIGYPDARYAMVKLTPEQQAKLVAEAPNVFVPVAGGWGRRGSTNVLLAAADRAAAKSALEIAWANVAPTSSAKLVAQREGAHRGKARAGIKSTAKPRTRRKGA
jgi:hypothetical protein